MRAAFLVLSVALATTSCHGALAGEDLAPYVCYPLAGEAQTLAIGDLNGDGRDDVAVAAWPCLLLVLYQQADGTLSAPVQLPAPNLPLGIAAGDLDGDGRDDLAVGGTNGLVFLYYQQADGWFGLPQIVSAYGHVNSIAIDDFSGDGRPDLATVNLTYPAVFVFRQEADGTFAWPEFYPLDGARTRCIQSLDANSDGRRDLALLLDDKACVLTQGAGGVFGAPTYLPAVWAHSLAAGDVTSDGRDDLVGSVAMNQPNAKVLVIPQASSGTFAAPSIYPAYDCGQPIALLDIDGDGRLDVATAHAGYEALTVHTQTAEGALGDWTAYPLPYSNGYQPGSLASGDLNSDGLPDLAIVDWRNGLVVLPHAATNADTTPPTVTASTSGVSGANGWYVSGVEVTLSADDGPGGSGVRSVLYTLDGIAWLPYTNAVVLAAEGTNRLGFRAEDEVGNCSEVQWIEVWIDTQPPALAVSPHISVLWPPNGATIDVPVDASGADTTSGLGTLRLRVVDEYGVVEPEIGVTASPISVPLVALRNDGDPDGRVYTLVLTGTDRAGNTAQASATVTVPKSGSDKPDKPKNPKK